MLTEYGMNLATIGKTPEELGVINQRGLNRKVRSTLLCTDSADLRSYSDQQHIFDSVKASLQRLQVDYIDLLQCESLQIS